MLALVGVWWLMTSRGNQTPLAEPQLADRGDALVKRLETRYGPLWSATAPLSDPGIPLAEQQAARYVVRGGQLEGRNIPAAYQQDWQTVSTLFPAWLTARIGEFVVFSDGPGGMLAFRQPPSTAAGSWALGLDPRDTGLNRLPALVEQSAALLALSGADMVTLKPGESCVTVMSSGGCLKADALMSRYYQKFWAGNLLREWQQRKVGENPAAAQAFAAAHPGGFVNVAAARGPEQDFAATWAAFVLQPRPRTALTEAERKINFFYGDPALVKLRLALLRKVSKAFPAGT